MGLSIALLALLGCTQQRLTVVAASSLTAPFSELAPAFSRQHDTTELSLSFAGSQTAATWIRHGLDAQVFASASPAHIDALLAEGLIHDPILFAHNRLVIAVPLDSGLTELSDLSEVQRLVIGTPEVPIGQYTDQLLAAATAVHGEAWGHKVNSAVVSREGNVRLVLSKVVLGEADAAIVYATDVHGVSEVRAVPLPDELAPRASYVLADVGAAGASAAWTQLVNSELGNKVLLAHGFELPQ